MAVNKPYFQPRYPCSDADPNIPMDVDSLKDVPVFWNQDQVGSDTVGLTGETFTTLEDEEYLAAIVPDPIKFPNRYRQIRTPRCVRMYATNAFYRSFSPVGSDIGTAKAFVIAIKEECVKHNIMFSVARNQTFGKLLFYPFDEIVSIEYTETVGTFTPNNPLVDSPYDAKKYKWADFNEDYLDDECYMPSDVLNFFTFDTPHYGNDFFWTDLGLNTANFTPKFFFTAPNDTYPQAIKYYKRQNEKTRQRTIVQKWPGNSVTSFYATGEISFDHMWNVFLSTNTDGLFEIGPEFSYDVDYYIKTIREHWSL